MKQKQKWKILNDNLPLGGVFCFIWVIYLGFIINYWYLSFLILVIFCFLKVKINKWQLLVLLCILLPFVFLIIFANDFSLVNLFNEWFEKATHGGLVSVCEKYFLKSFGKETTSFMKLVLFNVKSKETYVFLKQVVDLGIVWLISSGGFHLSLIARLNDKIFKKKQLIGYAVNIVLLSFYTFLLGFAYGCLRVLIKRIMKPVLKRKSVSNFNQLGLVGLIIGLFNPECFGSYSFVLSFLVCMGSYYVFNLNLNNKVISMLLVNLLAFLITIPFVIEMNKKVAILTFINSYIFVYFFSFVFIYFFIFSWFPFMGIVHGWIIKCCYVLIGNVSLANYFIKFSQWEAWIKTTYYLCLFLALTITYLIVKNNKI